MTTAVGSTEGAVVDAGDRWRRLSPRMLAVHPVMELRRLIFPLVAVLIGLRNGNGGDGGWWALGIGGVGIALGFLRYFTTSFRISPTQVQVRRGLFRRRVLTVPRDRIRTVDVTSNVLHRIFGLARVTVGTGQTDKKNDGVKLDGLSAGEAENLHRELLHRPTVKPSPDVDSAVRSQPAEAASETVLAALHPAWVRHGPFTLSGLVAIGVLFGIGSRLVNESHIDLAKIGFVHDSIDYLRGRPLPVAERTAAAAGGARRPGPGHRHRPAGRPGRRPRRFGPAATRAPRRRGGRGRHGHRRRGPADRGTDPARPPRQPAPVHPGRHGQHHPDPDRAGVRSLRRRALVDVLDGAGAAAARRVPGFGPGRVPGPRPHRRLAGQPGTAAWYDAATCCAPTP